MEAFRNALAHLKERREERKLPKHVQNSNAFIRSLEREGIRGLAARWPDEENFTTEPIEIEVELEPNRSHARIIGAEKPADALRAMVYNHSMMAHGTSPGKAPTIMRMRVRRMPANNLPKTVKHPLTNKSHDNVVFRVTFHPK